MKRVFTFFNLGLLIAYAYWTLWEDLGGTINFLLFLGCMLLLSVLVLWPTKQYASGNTNPHRAQAWIISAISLFLILTAMVVYVNPHGRYPWQFYPFSTSAAHLTKINLYSQLDMSPQIIILGSSHAYTIPSDYLAQVAGEKTFNMSVGGAGSIDELALARYVLDNNKKTPSLFLVEIVATDLGTRSWQYYMPLNLVPHLSTDQRSAVIHSIFRDTLGERSLSDSLFLLTRSNTLSEAMTFLPDGTGVRETETTGVNVKEYWEDVKKQTPEVYKRNVCTHLDKIGKQSIQKLALLSKTQHFNIIFYRSPLNIEFFDKVDLNNPRYKKCQSLFTNFMQGLEKKYPSIQYVDLFYYEPVSMLRRRGYVDVQHLSLDASKLVIDALRPAIEHGLQQVRQNR